MIISSTLRNALLLFAVSIILYGLAISPMFGFNEITGKNGGGFEFGFRLSSFVPIGVALLLATLYLGRLKTKSS